VLAKDGSRIRANVLVDEGSNTTVIREGFLRRLGLDVDAQQLILDGAGGTSATHQSKRVQLTMETMDGGSFTF